MNAVGQPVSRAESRLKVTGSAHYTADIPVMSAAHAAIVHGTIANGRTISIDTGAAEKAPGVVAVFTHRNLTRMNPTPKPWSHLHPHGQGYLPLQDDRIHYAGQPIALVVAETRDQATYAGTLVRVEYAAEPPVVFTGETAKQAVDPPQFLWPVASSVGDADAAIAAAPVRVDQTYTTADRHHNQMEPHATTAVWDANDTLTLYETTQHIFGARELVAIVLGLSPKKSGSCPTFSAAASAARAMSGRTRCWRRSPRRSWGGPSRCSSPARRCIRWPVTSRRRSRP